jgi:hypothetical protein
MADASEFDKKIAAAGETLEELARKSVRVVQECCDALAALGREGKDS